MESSLENILLIASILLLLGIFASKGVKLGIPALLLFIAVGMLAGSDGPGGMVYDDPWFSQSVGVVAFICILFAGGLDTPWRSVRPVFWKGLSLSTFGVLITAVSVGWFAKTYFGFTWLEGMLLGSIVSSTDAAAVFSVLRSRNVHLKNPLKPLLEFESGSNDPMAFLLTFGFITLIQNPKLGWWTLLPMFLKGMALGALFGFVTAKAVIFILKHFRFDYQGLYPVFTLAAALLTYALTAIAGGNGFLAVYLAGLLMGRENFAQKEDLLRFHDGLAWLMQIAMFVTLGLQVYPSQLPPFFKMGLVISLFLIFLARPLSVFIPLLFARDLSMRDKAFVSWVGLRGSAPIILATFPLLAGLPSADDNFNLVFFIVITSVLLQGPTIPWMAKLLKVEAK